MNDEWDAFADQVFRAVRAFIESGDLRDLDPVFPEAQARADSALAGTAPLVQIAHLASLHLVIGQQTNGLVSFGRVVDLVRAARRLPLVDAGTELVLRNLLCTALTERCARVVSPADEAEVLGLTEGVSLASTEWGPEMAIGMLNHRAAALASRYSRVRDPSDLEESLAIFRALVPRVTDPVMRAAVISNLASALHEAVDIANGPGMLDEAIELTEQSALQLGEAVESGRRVDLFTIRLGVNRIALLARRWRMLARSSDVDAALELVDQLETLLDALPDHVGEQERQGFFFNVGGLYNDIATVLGSVEACDLAVDHLRACVDASTASDPRSLAARSNLAVALAHRSEGSSGPDSAADADEAIAITRALLAEGVPAELTPLLHHNLAMALVDRFAAADDRDTADLDEAIALHASSSDSSPAEASEHDVILFRRALAHRLRHAVGHGDEQEQDLSIARELFARAADLPGVTLTRLQAIRQCAEISILVADWPAACDAVDTALRDVESVMGAVDDRRWEIWLSLTQGLGAWGAHAAAMTGDLWRAVDFLERGCGVMAAARLSQQGASLTAARAAGAGELVDAYEHAAESVRDVLVRGAVSPVLDLNSGLAATDTADLVAQLVAARTALEQAVPALRARAELPDLIGFVARTGEPLTYLAATPVGGMRFDIEPHDDRSPTVAVTGLPELDSDMVADLAVRIHAPDQADDPHGPQRLRGTALAPAGTEVAAVLDELRAAVVDEAPAPCRIVAVGTLGLLPLSVAWDVVSASPDVRPVAGSGLLHMTSNARAVERAGRRTAMTAVVAVTDPQPCHWLDGAMPRLPAAVEEGEHIAQLARGRHFTGAAATSWVLRDALTDSGADVVHIAAHGWTDEDDVDDVRLLLVDGDDGVSDFVTSYDIDQGVECGGVFLACCWLARTGVRLPDEAMGFPTRMIQGGASWVVAPLWPVDDRIASDVVRVFYDRLVTDRQSPREALGAASEEVRQRAAEDPLLGPAMRAEIVATADAFVLVGT